MTTMSVHSLGWLVFSSMVSLLGPTIPTGIVDDSEPKNLKLTHILVILLLEGWILPLIPLFLILSSIHSTLARIFLGKTETTIITETGSKLSHPFGFYTLGSLAMILSVQFYTWA